MSPLYLRLAVPAIELLAAIVIMRRIPWRSHPALIAYLASEFVTRAVVLSDASRYSEIVLALALVRIVARTAVTLEVLTFARVAIPPEIRGPAVGLALAASAFAAGCTPGLNVAQSTALFNQYYHLLLCVALSSIAVRRWLVPMLECRRHRVYRVGMAAWLAVIAGAGCFVRGGLAYRIFPYTKATWAAADMATYAALIVVVSVMAWQMVASLPKKVPAKVNRAIAVRFTRRIAA